MAGIELSAPYWIYTPDLSSYIKFNDSSDPNFVGYVRDITGIDDSEVRENAQNVVAGDGGYNGPFWRGRRPWTMSGFIVPNFPVAARSEAQRKLQYVMSQCYRSDGFLIWLPADGIRKMIIFRKQQPTRNPTGQSNVQRDFNIAGVAADWHIYSNIIQTVFTNVTPWTVTTNSGGDDTSPPRFVITGPIDAPVIVNNTTGKQFVFTAFGGSGLVPTGMSLTINLATPYPSIIRSDGVDCSGYVSPTSTNWDIGVAPGANSWTLSSLFGALNPVDFQSGFQINWNDAYQ